MRRREVITLIGGAAAAWPLTARAEPSGTPKVGYVWIGERSGDVSGDGLRQGLVDKGYEIGRNLMFEDRYAHGDIEKVPALITELLALKVDVLVTVGTSISLAARRATSTFTRLGCNVAILHDGAFAVPTPGNTALRQADEITRCCHLISNVP